MFLFPSPHFNVVKAAKSTGNLTYSTLKRGRGKLTGFNAISLKKRNKSEIVPNFG